MENIQVFVKTLNQANKLEILMYLSAFVDPSPRKERWMVGRGSGTTIRRILEYLVQDETRTGEKRQNTLQESRVST